MRDLCKALVAVGITTMLNGLWPLKYPVASGALTVLAGAIGLYFFRVAFSRTGNNRGN